jgi:hypothetical protein
MIRRIFSEDLIRCASDAIKKPEDFGYWGPEDMFETWGFCGIDKSQASDILEESNFETISQELLSQFPNDFRIETYRHWAVGQVTRLVCRVLNSKGEIEDKNITDAFKKAMEWKDKLANYPVANEDDYSDRLYQQNIDDIPQLRVAKFADQTVDNWVEKIVNELHNIGEYWDEHNVPSDSMIMQAIYNLQIWNKEYPTEWFEFADQNGLERPPFDLESISRWNKNQLSLFGDENGED